MNAMRIAKLIFIAALAPILALGGLRVPEREIPDSLVLGQGGFVFLHFYVDSRDSIVSWELKAISVWDTSKSEFKTVYQDPIKFLTWSERAKQYTATVKKGVRRIRLPLGTRLADRLTPWLRVFAKETRFEGSSRKKSEGRTTTECKEAILYSYQLDFGVSRLEKWTLETRRRLSPVMRDTGASARPK